MVGLLIISLDVKLIITITITINKINHITQFFVFSMFLRSKISPKKMALTGDDERRIAAPTTSVQGLLDFSHVTVQGGSQHLED